MQRTINENELLTKKHLVMEIKVKALNLLTNERIELVAENKEIIARMILNERCEFAEINNNVAYYNSKFAFNISEDINEAILIAAKRQIGIEVKGVRICSYFEEELYEIKELTNKTI